MTLLRFVQEEDIDTARFTCCGDEDLFPFKCSACGLPMIFCYECGSLYEHLPDTSRHTSEVNHFDPASPHHVCRRCGHAFEYHFMRNPRYQVSMAEWHEAGLDQLLYPDRA